MPRGLATFVRGQWGPSLPMGSGRTFRMGTDLWLTWSCGGVVTGRRELKTKAGEVWKRIVQIATLGSTAEVEVPPEQYERLAYGERIECSGVFEFYQGRPNFIGREFRAVTADAGPDSAPKAPTAPRMKAAS